MIKWNKKTYARELKKGYWDLEPHFWYYCQLEFFSTFRTIIDEKLTYEDYLSAIYGKFVCEGKPILKKFYNNFNFMSKMVDEIMEYSLKKSKGKILKMTIKLKEEK